MVKNPPATAGDEMQVQSLSGRSPGEGNGSPLQYSCLEIPMDRGAWQATVHGVTESRPRRKQLSLWTQSCYRCPLVLVLLECGPPAPSYSGHFLLSSPQSTSPVDPAPPPGVSLDWFTNASARWPQSFTTEIPTLARWAP